MLIAVIILASSTVLLGVVIWKQRGIITTLVEKRKQIVVEEHRMFSFLHGLGECLQKSRSQGELYQLIVEGAARVVNAHDGALYLLGSGGSRLVPKAVTPNCPAFFPLKDPPARDDLRSYLKLKTVRVSQASVLGAALTERRGIHLKNLWSHESFGHVNAGFPSPLPAMLAPLHFGNRDLGVLAAAGKTRHFTANDFAVFRSLADQCSLALGTAMLRRQATARFRLEKEMAMAREVQRILLPDAPPAFDGYQIAAANHPASILSGDYFDFIPIDDQHLGVTVADVSGKGLPASLIMTMGRTVLRANASRELSPARALSAVNRILFPDIREDRFISMLYLILERGETRIRMARAGHDAPLVYRAAGGIVESFNPPGLAVGIDRGEVFNRVTQDVEFTLDKGDVVLMYTDGLNEAMNAEGEEFGVERIRSALRETGPEGASAVLAHVLDSAREFIGEYHQSDDMTLVVLEKT